ncbi:hypothetical protein TcWFU_000913 [Taenia crassiceps]|uniref:Hexosyltransferase n=1 Tax=Taenia crassiceps TaxID=6207 RepID=A0ABR4Q3B8_9CEST
MNLFDAASANAYPHDMAFKYVFGVSTCFRVSNVYAWGPVEETRRNYNVHEPSSTQLCPVQLHNGPLLISILKSQLVLASGPAHLQIALEFGPDIPCQPRHEQSDGVLKEVRRGTHMKFKALIMQATTDLMCKANHLEFHRAGLIKCALILVIPFSLKYTEDTSYRWIKVNSLKNSSIRSFENALSEACHIAGNPVLRHFHHGPRKLSPVRALYLAHDINSTNAPKYTVLDQFVLRKGAKAVPLQFDDLKAIHDHLWRLPVHPQVYKTYPQAINISETVDRLMKGRPIEEAPINNMVFRYIEVGKSVCHPDIPSSRDYDVLVMIKSGVANFERRANFRRMYKSSSADWERLQLGIRIGLVFSVGLRISQQNVLHRNGRTFQLYSNEESANHTAQLLEEELVNNDDLIVGEYEDNYFNLTMKMQYSYLWVATFCQRSRPTVLFLDDDGLFSGIDLARTLHKMLSKQRDDLIYGKLVRRGRVYRYNEPGFDKWGVSKSEVPWPEYPPYPYGIYVLMSYPNIQRLALGLIATRMDMRFRNIHHLIPRARLLRAWREVRQPIDWQWSA